MAHQFLRSAPGALMDPLVFGSEQEANATDASIIFSLHHNQSLFESANLDDNDLSSRPLYRGHQRRQSVAKLLPDVSKLRLLSWLVEASNELINCDIAIMDGVYGAKQRRINLNDDSLALFWSHQEQQAHQPILADQYNLISQKYQQQQPPVKPHRKAAPASKGNKNNNDSRDSSLQVSASTNHIGNDSSSVAGISIASWLTPKSSRAATNNNSDQAKQQQLEKAASKQTRAPTSTCKHKAACVCSSQAKASMINKPPFSLSTTIGDNNRGNNTSSRDHFCDSNRSEDDDDNSAAGSSSAASSSGINGSGSISSAAKISSSSVLSTSRGSSITSTVSSDLGQQFRFASSRNYRQLHLHHLQQQQQMQQQQQQQQQQAPVYVNPVELLREKIKVTVMEHNHLQNLLVNMIRQHDELRALFNQQIANPNESNNHHQLYQHQQSSPRSFKKLRFDLTEIADSLNDGCFCNCHSMPKEMEGFQEEADETAADGDEFDTSTSKLEGSILTLPPGSLPSRSLSSSSNKKQRKVNTIASVWSSSAATSNSNSQQQQQQLKKKKFLRYKSSSNSNEINRRDLIEMMPDKLCENCFETHYWLHSCSLDLIQAKENSKLQQSTTGSGKQHGSSSCSRDSNDEAIVAKRNSNFIKLVQQEVRSTIGRSIELIDLIRKLSKSPDSINKKQLMRCFSNSIQLLTSVGNYIVPTQDMTSFLPEANKHAKTTLFCLPSNDFEHLLPYSSSINFNQQAGQDQQTKYHLAPAPVIPIRRRLNQESAKSTIPTRGAAQHSFSRNPLQRTIEQSRLISNSTSNNNNSNIRKALKSINDNDSPTNNKATTTGTITTSSSGVSSNNSSASSSIARGTVQQSSLTRAQTSSAILDGRTSHDLSLYEFSSFAKQRHTEDDMLFTSNSNKPKFWQSSKFNFIKKLLQVKQQRLLRKQSKDRRIYNNKIQHKFRLVMMDLSHFKKSQQLLSTENGVNSMLASMRNVLEFGLYLTLKLY